MPAKLRKVIGSNLRRLREIKGATQYHLAAVAHVEQSTISRIENGETDMLLEVAWRLARFLDCTLEDLLRPRRWDNAPYADEPALG